MQVKYSRNFDRKFEKLSKKNAYLEKKINGKLRILKINPNHPSLRLHKIEGKVQAWSISVDMGIRILFVYRDYGILLIDIGGHDEVY